MGSTAALKTQRAVPTRRRQAVATRAGLFGLGLPERVVIGGVAALAFGPSKLPELGKSLGKTVKSFQTAAKARLPGLTRPTEGNACDGAGRRSAPLPVSPPLSAHT